MPQRVVYILDSPYFLNNSLIHFFLLWPCLFGVWSAESIPTVTFCHLFLHSRSPCCRNLPRGSRPNFTFLCGLLWSTNPGFSNQSCILCDICIACVGDYGRPVTDRRLTNGSAEDNWKFLRPEFNTTSASHLYFYEKFSNPLTNLRHFALPPLDEMGGRGFFLLFSPLHTETMYGISRP